MENNTNFTVTVPVTIPMEEYKALITELTRYRTVLELYKSGEYSLEAAAKAVLIPNEEKKETEPITANETSCYSASPAADGPSGYSASPAADGPSGILE